MLHARQLLDPGEQHDHDHRFGWSRSAGLADHDDRNPQIEPCNDDGFMAALVGGDVYRSPPSLSCSLRRRKHDAGSRMRLLPLARP